MGLDFDAQAQEPVALTPPTPAAALPAPSNVEERLRSQDEMIRQLAEQNRRLSEQLEAVTRRLDALATPPAPPAATPPTGGPATNSGGPPAGGPVPTVPAPAVVSDGDDDDSAPSPGYGTDPDPNAPARPDPELYDSLHQDDDYGLKSLFDSLHPARAKRTPWHEKLSIRGYTQFRFGRGVDEDPFGAEPFLLGDRTINGNAENFSIRRARLIIYGDISDHLYLYFQPDFASTPPGSTTAVYFGQLRDLYGDVFLDEDKVHRFRVGLSKVPFGWENMQSSQNRVPLDRTDAINTAVSPNERDLGVFYYWTPERKQDLLRELVDGGLKGSGNYGILGAGIYNGQGGSQVERNLNLHTVARLTWPFRLESGQVVEASLQGYTGEFVVLGTPIRPLGQGPPLTPAGTNDTHGQRDQRLGATFVWYPQPFGLQAEWNVGEGPGLNDRQTAVVVRPLKGGYVLAMYKLDTKRFGIFTPYVRYQNYFGGYRSVSNAPYGEHSEWDLGVEWQIRKEMELVAEYSLVDGLNLNAINRPGALSYTNFEGSVLRFQFQVNY
jgi:hypothetical protein